MHEKKIITYIVLGLCGIFMIMPFAWMLATSVKAQLEINKGNNGFIPYIESDFLDLAEEGELLRCKILKPAPGDSLWINIFDEEGAIIASYLKVPASAVTHKKSIKFIFSNFSNAWKKVPFGRYFLNTIIVSCSSVFGVIITGCLAAYAFARMKFAGKELLFYLFISMMMVPQPVYIIPSYILLHKLGWLNTYYALIVPWLANIFTIFLLRQHFKTLPQELFDAASIDGCSRFGALWRIVLPLSKGVIATAAIFAFIGSWNSFMWPLVMIDSPKLRVLQVGLSYFSAEASSQTALLMAASTFSILPLVLLFLIAQKQIMASFISSGLKG
jgi:multiple sugar transport system permease protein